MACLETTFLIDILRGNKDALKLMEILDSGSESKTIATPSIMELVSGAIANPKLANEKDKVINFVSALSALNLSKKSAILAGEIEADLIKKGSSIEIEDIMIAAIAIENDETLITRNKKHFERIKGLKIDSY